MNKKVGRNDPCPCGSKKKYKKCCYDKERKPTQPNQGLMEKIGLTGGNRKKGEAVIPDRNTIEQHDLAPAKEEYLKYVEEGPLDADAIFNSLVAIHGRSREKEDFAFTLEQILLLFKEHREVIEPVEGYLLLYAVESAILLEDQEGLQSAIKELNPYEHGEEYFRILKTLLHFADAESLDLLAEQMQGYEQEVRGHSDKIPPYFATLESLRIVLDLLGTAESNYADTYSKIKPYVSEEMDAEFMETFVFRPLQEGVGPWAIEEIQNSNKDGVQALLWSMVGAWIREYGIPLGQGILVANLYYNHILSKQAQQKLTLYEAIFPDIDALEEEINRYLGYMSDCCVISVLTSFYPFYLKTLYDYDLLQAHEYQGYMEAMEATKNDTLHILMDQRLSQSFLPVVMAENLYALYLRYEEELKTSE